MLDYTAALPTLRARRIDRYAELTRARAQYECNREAFAAGACGPERVEAARQHVERCERGISSYEQSRESLAERRTARRNAQRARRIAKREADRLLGRKRKRPTAGRARPRTTPNRSSQAAPRAASRQRRSRTAASASRDSGSSGSDSDPPPPDLYSVPEAADEIGKPERTLSTWIDRPWTNRRRNLAVSVPYRIGDGGKRFLTPETVEALARLVDHAGRRRVTVAMAAEFLS